MNGPRAAYHPEMRRRNRREIDSLIGRLFLATAALTVVGMLASQSRGISPDTSLVIGCVLMVVETGIQAFYGTGSE
jgi:hypothetical protein